MDPLSRFRQAIASNSAIVPTTSNGGDDDDGGVTTPPQAVNLASATHLHFAGSGPTAPHSFPLDTPTRFAPLGKPVDLRSIYFAWLRKDVAIPDYVAEAQRLSEQLAAAGVPGAQVQNLVFVQRLDLITWLEGASEESEFIKPLAGADASTDAGDDGAGTGAARAATIAVVGDPARAAAGAAGAVGGGSGGGGPAATGASAGGGGATAGVGGGVGRQTKPVNPRLMHVYKNERRMSDRNIQLRGVKPSVSALHIAFQLSVRQLVSFSQMRL
jgi:parafibromin